MENISSHQEHEQSILRKYIQAQETCQMYVNELITAAQLVEILTKIFESKEDVQRLLINMGIELEG